MFVIRGREEKRRERDRVGRTRVGHMVLGGDGFLDRGVGWREGLGGILSGGRLAARALDLSRDVLYNILYLKHDGEYLYIHLSVSLVRCGVDNQRFIH